MPKKLPRSFYDRPTLEVARDLLGKHLVFGSKSERLSAKIVEVEAYIGRDDPACHAARGETKRNRVMFGKPGVSYIYLIYGMYSCFNFVTEKKGFPAAVLLRAAEPVDGVEGMLARSPKSNRDNILSGPGKFCRAFGLTTEHSGLDLSDGRLCVEDHGKTVSNIATAPRIGISKGEELHWRFCDADSQSLSRPVQSVAKR